jgi:hypothetical protein
MPDMLDDPAAMTPSQRRREIAAILARGVLRLRQCGKTSAGSGESRAPEEASESDRNCLERDATSSPPVPTG